MLDHVIDACAKAASYLHRKDRIQCTVAVLTPEKDPIADAFANRCDIYEGPGQDVLARYAEAANFYKPDYVVRITGDCPLIPSYVISRIVSLAVQHRYDYISNVDERFRTALDGIDCEAISYRLLQAIDDEAHEPRDREHVTTYLRRSPPDWAQMGAVVNYFDHSDMKLSVDTREDLDRVRGAFDKAQEKYHLATRTFGNNAVHTL